MLTNNTYYNNFIHQLIDTKARVNNVSELIKNYIKIKENSCKIDIDHAYKIFARYLFQYKNLSSVTDNNSYNNRNIISKKLNLTDDIYLLIKKYNIVNKKHNIVNNSVSSFKVSMEEKVATKIINENSTFQFLATEYATSDYNSVATIEFFFIFFDAFHDEFYPEEYQPLAKFVYDIQNMPITELQKIYPEIESKKSQLRLQAVKLNYSDYLNGNYYQVVDINNSLSIEAKINKFTELSVLISNMASPIINFKIDLLAASENLIKKHDAFLIDLCDIIDQSYYFNNNNIKPIAKWNALIKKITPNIKTCDQFLSTKLKPKFHDDDEFYLLFETNVNNSNKFHSFKKATNIKELELNDLIAKDEQLNFINKDAKNKGYGDIINDWNILYQYEPEMYQQLAKWCYNILNNEQKINVHLKEIRDTPTNLAIIRDISSYESIILKYWQVAKISYKDYITGNYKLTVDYKYPFSISTKLSYQYEILSTKQDLLLAHAQIQEIISPIRNNLKKALNYLKQFYFKKIYASEKDNNNYKINILKPLFIPINTENSLLTIQDFCLSVDLILGDIYQDASSTFKQARDLQNKTQKNKKTNRQQRHHPYRC